jgi:hypothetical protein
MSVLLQGTTDASLRYEVASRRGRPGCPSFSPASPKGRFTGHPNPRKTMFKLGKPQKSLKN